MIYKRTIKIIINVIFIFTILLLLNRYYIIHKSKENIEEITINTTRVHINPIYNYITDNIHNIDYNKEQKIYEMTKDINSVVSITDQKGKVLLTNNKQIHTGDTVDLKEFLYYSNSYRFNNNKYKISFPLIKENEFLGNVTFEIEKEKPMYISNSHKINYDTTFIAISLICVIISYIIYLQFLNYTKKTKNNHTILMLNEGLLKVSKGILKPIEIKDDNNLSTVFCSFNLKVEELTYILKKQEDYESNRKKLLTMICHELKTPITSIVAYVEALKSNIAKDDATRIKYINVIDDKINKLSNQIEELFKYSQKDINKLKINLEEKYADEVFSRILIPIKKQFRNSTIKFDMKNTIPKVLVNIDEIRIEQVILNLVNNAVKHVDKEGYIEILAFEENNNIVISVLDNGAGIKPSELAYVFDYFYQGNTSKNLDYQGVGLGLAICKDIVEKHNGKIYVKSSEKKGSEFIFTIPVV